VRRCAYLLGDNEGWQLGTARRLSCLLWARLLGRARWRRCRSASVNVDHLLDVARGALANDLLMGQGGRSERERER